MSEEEFNEYKPLKAFPINDRVFEIAPIDILEYGDWPPIVRIDKATGKIIGIRRGDQM